MSKSREKPISLRPLKFKEAVADLLKVKPPGKVHQKRAGKPKGNTRSKPKKNT